MLLARRKERERHQCRPDRRLTSLPSPLLQHTQKTIEGAKELRTAIEARGRPRRRLAQRAWRCRLFTLPLPTDLFVALTATPRLPLSNRRSLAAPPPAPLSPSAQHRAAPRRSRQLLNLDLGVSVPNSCA